MDEIRDKYKKLKGVFVDSLAGEIVKDINNISLDGLTIDELKELRAIYSDVGDLLLANSVNLKEYELEAIESKLTKRKKSKSTENLVEDDSIAIIDEFIKTNKNVLKHLKGIFVLTLEIGKPKDIDIYFVHDLNLKSIPLINTFKAYFTNLQIESIDNFRILNFTDTRIILLLYISENITDDKAAKDTINDILSKFNKYTLFKLCIGSNEKVTYRTESSKEEILNEIDVYSRRIFNNDEFTQEEEILIKKFFSDDCSILNYKTLKGGHSGVKVIEVQALKSVGVSLRLVIKIDSQKSKKILKEKQVFDRFVYEYGISGYTCDHKTATDLEAIAYRYASNGFDDSYSFAYIINDYIFGKHKLEIDINQTIEKLFTCEPLITWQKLGSMAVKRKIGSLYQKYINFNELEKAVNKIYILDSDRNEAITSFQELIEKEIQVNEKHCHGDFHTENIFRDVKGDVYLIDYAWTEKIHSLIDHMFLEASVKFNHIPRYIPIDELIKIEDELFNIKSFDETFDLSFITRPELKEIYGWIIKTRADAKKYFVNKSEILEYMVGLSIISFRMMQFNDLNQLFAIKSATFLCQKILDKIDLST
jgi:hypothetical protein